MRYLIYHNNKDVFHPIIVEDNVRIESGQPIKEEFDNLEEMNKRYFELTGKHIEV